MKKLESSKEKLLIKKDFEQFVLTNRIIKTYKKDKNGNFKRID